MGIELLPARTNYVFPNTDWSKDEPGWLSPSQVTEFLKCGACYELARVRKLPRPLGVALPFGSAVHKAVEVARRTNKLGNDAKISRLGIEEAVQAALEHFEAEVSQPTDEETGQPIDAEIELGSKYKSLGEVKDEAAALAEFVVPRMLELDRRRGKVAAVEFNLSMLTDVRPYPFAIQGRIDCLYVDWLADASKPELAGISSDLKTSAKQEPPDEYTAIAQTIYAEHWSMRGLPLVVMVDVADKRIHPDLKPYPLSIDDESRALTHQTVLSVAEDISAGRFRPHPTWQCGFIHGFPEFQIAVSGFAES